MSMIETVLSQLPTVATFGAGMGGGFYAVKWLLEWIAGRFDKQRAALDAGWKEYRTALEARLAASEGRIADLEREVADCHMREAKAEARALRYEAMLQGVGDAKNLLQIVQSMERTVTVPTPRGAWALLGAMAGMGGVIASLAIGGPVGRFRGGVGRSGLDFELDDKDEAPSAAATVTTTTVIAPPPPPVSPASAQGEPRP